MGGETDESGREGKGENIVTNQSNYDGKILNHMWVAMTLHILPSLPWKFIILVTHTSSITALWQKAINKRDSPSA